MDKTSPKRVLKMKLQNAAKLLRHGIPIRRSFWRRGLCLVNVGESMCLQEREYKVDSNWTPTISDLTAKDWMILFPVGVKIKFKWFKDWS